MQRRDFIVKSGTMISAAALIGTIGNLNSLNAASSPNKAKKNDKRPNPNDFSQPIMKAIAIGINAPSPHNTQSWKFKIVDDNSMLFYVDETRFLPATDPTQRQIHMGAGCFIETLAIGVEKIGYSAQIDYFPEQYNGKNDYGIKPVAKVTLSKSNNTVSELASYIQSRATNRKAYKGDMITQAEFDALINSTGSSFSTIKFISDSEKIKTYNEMLIKAMELESYKYETHDESRKMMRFSERERAEKRDGLSIPQVGFTGIMVPLAEMTLKGGPKAWHKKKSLQRHMDTFTKAVNSAKGYVTFTTNTNEVIDWVKTGRDFVRFCLSMTKHKIDNNPHTQITQEYEEMWEMTKKLHELENIKGSGKMQLILRIGRAESPYYSYRRLANDFVIQ